MNFKQRRTSRVIRSFKDHSNKKLACQIADTVDDARLYRLGYCQDGREMRADYYDYVYDTSFARQRRRKKFRK